MKEKTMIRPTKDMTTTVIPREQLLALLQGDDAMRALVQTIVQETLEAEMEEVLGAVKTRAARTNPSAVLPEAAATYVRADPTARNGVLEHLRARAGTWDGPLSGQELLRRTRR
jgi:transposase-like protein